MMSEQIPLHDAAHVQLAVVAEERFLEVSVQRKVLRVFVEPDHWSTPRKTPTERNAAEDIGGSKKCSVRARALRSFLPLRDAINKATPANFALGAGERARKARGICQDMLRYASRRRVHLHSSMQADANHTIESKKRRRCRMFAKRRACRHAKKSKVLFSSLFLSPCPYRGASKSSSAPHQTRRTQRSPGRGGARSPSGSWVPRLAPSQ